MKPPDTLDLIKPEALFRDAVDEAVAYGAVAVIRDECEWSAIDAAVLRMFKGWEYQDLAYLIAGARRYDDHDSYGSPTRQVSHRSMVCGLAEWAADLVAAKAKRNLAAARLAAQKGAA